MSNFKTENRIVGHGQPVYIIAELSANHEQNLDLAKRSIEAMKAAGADAVKLQTYRPESMTLDADFPWFKTRESGPWAGQKLFDLYRKAYTPWDWHEELQQLAHSLGMDFFSSPFDFNAVDFLENLNVPLYKIASPEITDIPLIKKCAETGKPIIFSTGIAAKEDIRLAIETCKAAGNNKTAVLKCTTAYPTPFDELNLNQIKSLQKDFDSVIGISDHSQGIEVPIAAVALEAKIIEKHFILDKAGDGLDKSFSLDPNEFSQMVQAVRNTELALGNSDYLIPESVKSGYKPGRSLFAVQDIKKGEPFTEQNIRSLRPGIGLHPKYYYQILHKKNQKELTKGEPLSHEHIE
jgi:pseudaminic acid synthase